jgi:hypothetical protein
MAMVGGSVSDPIVQQKQASITVVTDWYNKVNSYLVTHLSFIESLIQKLDKKVKVTAKAVKEMIEFFKERAHREEESIKHKCELKKCF